MTITYSDSAKRCSFVWCAHNALTGKYPNLVDAGLSAEKLSKIIGKDFDEESFNHIYDPNSDDMDRDLQFRVFDVISDHYIGQPWFTYSDESYKKLFYSKLTAAIESETT
jgi:hypothetical protein